MTRERRKGASGIAAGVGLEKVEGSDRVLYGIGTADLVNIASRPDHSALIPAIFAPPPDLL